jgi:hypothetical protein
MHKPWRHRTSLEPDAGVVSGMPSHHPLYLFRIRSTLTAPNPSTGVVNNADGRRFLRYVQTNKKMVYRRGCVA